MSQDPASSAHGQMVLRRAPRTASVTGALQRIVPGRRRTEQSPADATSQSGQPPDSGNAPGDAAPGAAELHAGRDGNGAHPAARQRRTPTSGQ